MESKKTKIISIVAIVALLLVVITATYAYFNAQVGDPAAADVKINANTVDTFTFSSGSEISFSINQENFASGAGNQTGSTYASAMLTANNKTNTATEHYYLYLKIEKNTFTYSINTNTPEIIMTIKDSSGTEVTDISTLNHVIVTGANGTQVSGYDITNKSGLITLFDNREITTTSSKEEKWNITITFVNYDENQNGNAGKSMNAKVMIQKEAIPRAVSDVCANGENLATCITTLSNKSIPIATNIYYHNGTIISEDGTVIDANDKSYRYSGANPNNYVCFGSNDSTCSTDNLYRIIGVFGDQVKLIKYDYATSALLGTDGDYHGKYSRGNTNYKGSNYANIASYYWNNSRKNTWSESKLNKTNLNTNFITNIGSTWANKIATTTWKVGGNTWDNIGSKTPSIAYQNEIVKPESGSTSTTGETEYTAKIGLMYVSDYGFAAEPSAWTLIMGNYNNTTATSTNWMYMGLYDWTISRNAGNSDRPFLVSYGGHVTGIDVYYDFGCRPSFNLESFVTYVSGSGTQSDPIRIN